MIQAFLEDELVQFELCDNLLQPRVLFLEAFQFRQLGATHPAKPLPPVVLGCIANPDALASGCHVIARCQLKLDLTQQLQHVFV